MLFKTVTVNCSTRIYFPVLHGMRDFPKWLHWWVCLVHSLYLSETLITQVFKVLCQSLYNCLFLCFACSPPLPQHLWTLLTASPAPLLSSSFLLRRFEFLKVWFVLCSYSIAACSSFVICFSQQPPLFFCPCHEEFCLFCCLLRNTV